MTLYDKVNMGLDLLVGSECTYQGGMDFIEKAYITGAPYGGVKWMATLKYAGDVDMDQVTLK